MPIYRARVIHGRTGGEGDHDFEGPDDLMTRSPIKVMRYFMEHATEKGLIEHHDYEIFSALKDSEHAVVTVLGDYLYTSSSRSPFMCMIARKA